MGTPNERDLSAFQVIAVDHLRVGRLDEAASWFNRKIALAPQRAQSLLEIAGALFYAGKFRQASSTCEKILARHPDFAVAHNRLGEAICALGNHQHTVVSFDESVALSPSDPVFLGNLKRAMASS
jgi:protein O-GlcNAc transferase